MASTKLTRTQTAGTNRKKFTLSMWVKRTVPKGASDVLTGLWCTEGGWYDGTGMACVFRDDDGSNIMTIYNPSEGGTGGNYNSTTQKFRDINGWYHFVFAGDTTQSTQADRLKIYVNGERISYETNNLPAQDVFWNDLNSNNKTFTIGAGSGSGYYYHDGIMSHVHMSDGYCYDADTFGEEDSTTGEWTIKTSPSFTLGNNGFTILKDGNTITDQSTNSNNFTLSGTLTKTEDCPSNFFATMNPLIPQGTVTYSNGNNTVVIADNNNSAGTIGVNSGKYYYEVKQVNLVGNGWVGENNISDLGSNLNGRSSGWLSFSNFHGNIYHNGNNDTTPSIGSNNDIVGCAVDFDNGKIYWHQNGTYISTSGGQQNPTTQANPITFTTGNDFWFPVIGSYSDNPTAQANFGNGYFGTTAVSSAGTNASGIGIFEHDVPAGYTALSTKGLNE
jgi:hypothetical protein